MTDKIDISPEAVAAMLDGVTPGPWAAVGRFVDAHVLQIADLNAGRTGHEDANTRFIAWAREAVPALAARLVEVEKSRMDLAGDKINLRSENIALQARAEAAEARVSELEAVLDTVEREHSISSNGNMWRFWSDRACKMAASAASAEALLSEAVKAGMLRAIGIAYVTCAETTDETPVDAVADAIETAADDPETIASIVAQVNEGRG